MSQTGKIEFGSLEVVDKTFVRANVQPRGQAYTGIKFRRYLSEAGIKEGGEAKLKEVFIISDKAYAELQLDVLALTQANLGGLPYLLALEDQEEKKPVAKFMRRSTKKDGTKQDKTPMFSNVFLKNVLEESGILDGVTTENQYIALSDVTADFAGLPDHVKGVFALSKDTSVDASADTEDETTAEVADRAKF